MKIILIIVLGLILLAYFFGWYRTVKSERSSNQKLFLSGHVPDPLPDGFYRGSVTGYSGDWQGKSFNKTTGEGINIFNRKGKESKEYPFKTYVAKGIRDKALATYKIDYNIPTNPFWVRYVLDEIVEQEQGIYLGKLHLRTPFGLTFTLGYFRLER